MKTVANYLVLDEGHELVHVPQNCGHENVECCYCKSTYYTKGHCDSCGAPKPMRKLAPWSTFSIPCY